MSILVAFEGIPASGKSVAIKGVVAELNKRGVAAIKAEFKGVDNAPQIKALLDSTEGISRTLLFWLSRLEQVRKIQELSLPYEVVIADRYIASLVVFDGFDSEPVPPTVLEWISGYFPKPDATFLLQVPVEVAEERMKKDIIQIDMREKILTNKDFVKKAVERYQKLSRDSSWVTIDATKSVDEVVDKCVDSIITLLEQK